MEGENEVRVTTYSILSWILIFCAFSRQEIFDSIIHIRKDFVVLNMKIYNLTNMPKSELEKDEKYFCLSIM